MLFGPIIELAAGCRALNKVITIETAGTIHRELDCDLMSISPKLANSTPDDIEWRDRHEAARLDFDVLQRLIDSYPYQLKFVVGDDLENDLDEIERILARLRDIQPGRVLLMPEGRDVETLHRRARALVQPAMRRNWRLSPRLQIDLFGDTKGT
jgi:7-carboxy-7-deazaguanine synthase